MKYLTTGAAIAALLVFTPPASATLVTAGSTVNVDWTEPVVGGGANATLSGTLQLTNFDFSATNAVTFTINIANDTQQGTLTSAQLQSVRLTAFGFNTDPDATNISDTSTVFNTSATSNQPLPSFGKLDFCAFA